MIWFTIIVTVVAIAYTIKEYWEQRSVESQMEYYAELVDKLAQVKYDMGYRDGVADEKERHTFTLEPVTIKEQP